MVLRYTRTRSVDTRPLVSGARRGERTPRVSVGEDCSTVTVSLRPCFGIWMRRRRGRRSAHPDGGGQSVVPAFVRVALQPFGPVWYVVCNGSDRRGVPGRCNSQATSSRR